MCNRACHVLYGNYKHKHKSVGVEYDSEKAPIYKKALEIVAKEREIILTEGEAPI